VDYSLKKHLVSQKEGLIGILVVLLPSKLEGGKQLILSDGKPQAFIDKGGVKDQLSYFAFKTGSSKKLLPILSEYQVFLTFNISGHDACSLSGEPFGSKRHELIETLSKWTHLNEDFCDVPMLLYIFDQYTLEGMSFEGLNMADKSVAKILLDVAPLLQLSLYFCQVKICYNSSSAQRSYSKLDAYNLVSSAGQGFPYIKGFKFLEDETANELNILGEEALSHWIPTHSISQDPEFPVQFCYEGAALIFGPLETIGKMLLYGELVQETAEYECAIYLEKLKWSEESSAFYNDATEEFVTPTGTNNLQGHRLHFNAEKIIKAVCASKNEELIKTFLRKYSQMTPQDFIQLKPHLEVFGIDRFFDVFEDLMKNSSYAFEILHITFANRFYEKKAAKYFREMILFEKGLLNNFAALRDGGEALLKFIEETRHPMVIKTYLFRSSSIPTGFGTVFVEFIIQFGWDNFCEAFQAFIINSVTYIDKTLDLMETVFDHAVSHSKKNQAKKQFQGLLFKWLNQPNTRQELTPVLLRRICSWIERIEFTEVSIFAGALPQHVVMDVLMELAVNSVDKKLPRNWRSVASDLISKLTRYLRTSTVSNWPRHEDLSAFLNTNWNYFVSFSCFLRSEEERFPNFRCSDDVKRKLQKLGHLTVSTVPGDPASQEELIIISKNILTAGEIRDQQQEARDAICKLKSIYD